MAGPASRRCRGGGASRRPDPQRRPRPPAGRGRAPHRRQHPTAPPWSAARRRSPAPTTPSSTPASTRSTPSCAAPADRRRPRPATCSPPPPCGGASSLDPDNRALDDEFAPRSIAAIRTTESWTERAPDDAEAWFYLGGAYAARVQWRVLREERVAAARDGKRIKQALERAIALDAGPRGRLLRHRALQVLRRRRAGRGQGAALPPAAARRQQDRRARADAARAQRRTAAAGRGRLPAPPDLPVVRAASRRARSSCCEALHEALSGQSALPGADRRDPGRYQHDITASLATWRGAARRGARSARQRARRSPRRRRGSASRASSRRCTRPIDALELLQGIVTGAAPAPYGIAVALAHLRLGEAHDRLGSRPAAVAAYRQRRGRGAAPTIPYKVASAAAELMRRAPNARAPRPIASRSRAGAASRKNDLPAATEALERSLALNVDDPVAHYRFGRVLEARSDDAGGAGALRAHDPQRAHLPGTDRRHRVPRSGAPLRAPRPPRRGDATTTATTTLFGGGRRRAAPRPARSRASFNTERG